MLAVETKLDPFTLVAAYYGAIGRQDYKALLQLITPNARFNLAGNPDPMDKNGMIDTLKMFAAAFPDLQYRIDEIVVDGDRAFVRVVGHGTHKGDFQGLKATGHYGEAQSMSIFRFESDRIAEAWLVIDMLGIVAAIQGPEVQWPSKEDKKGLVARFIEAHNSKGDLKGFDKLLADNYLHHDPRLPQPEIYGREGYRQMVQGFEKAFPDYKLTLADSFTSGDRVVARWIFEGTQKGEFKGVPASNKPVKVTANSVYRLRHGKIVEGWVTFDFATLMRQIGAIKG